MIATFDSARCYDTIPELAQAFQCCYVDHCSEYLLRIPEEIGKGNIRGIDFDNGLSLSEWNCSTNDDGLLCF